MTITHQHPRVGPFPESEDDMRRSPMKRGKGPYVTEELQQLREEAAKLDRVVHALGLEDSHEDPAEAIETLQKQLETMTDLADLYSMDMIAAQDRVETLQQHVGELEDQLEQDNTVAENSIEGLRQRVGELEEQLKTPLEVAEGFREIHNDKDKFPTDKEAYHQVHVLMFRLMGWDLPIRQALAPGGDGGEERDRRPETCPHGLSYQLDDCRICNPRLPTEPDRPEGE